MKLLNKNLKPQNVTKNDGEMPPEETVKVAKSDIRRVVFLLVTVILVTGIGILATKFKHLFIVAKVNGTYITRYELANELIGVYGASELENLITYRLVREALAEEGIVVSADDLDSEISKVEENLAQQGQTLEAALSMQGLSIDEFKERLEVDLAINKKFEGMVDDPSEEDVTAYLENYSFAFENMEEDEARTQAIESIKSMQQQQIVGEWVQTVREAADVTSFLDTESE